MHSYEAMVIIDPQLEEGDINKTVDAFLKAITDNGGQVGNVDRWGKRRFAYEINHMLEGYYFVADFQAPEEAIDRLKRTLQVADEIIRGKIVRPTLTNAAKQGATT